MQQQQIKLTYQEAAQILSGLGLNLSKLDEFGNFMDEFRVAPKGTRKDTEAQAYYTPDLADAVTTGYAMVAQYQRTGVLAVHQRRKEASHA